MASNVITQSYKYKVTNVVRESIVSKCIDGNSVKTISSMMGINYHTVYSIVKKFLKTGKTKREIMGGNRKPKLASEIKEALLTYVDLDCAKTLKELKEWLQMQHGVNVSISTIDRTLKNFHYTLKTLTAIPEKIICQNTIDKTHKYAQNFRVLEKNVENKSIIFIDEIGFSVVSRPKKIRKPKESLASSRVPAARSRKISVMAAMNK